MSSLRQSEIKRKTNETDISGNGISEIDTGIPFLDHMLHQISSHGLFDLKIKAIGDTHIDDHHTNEDVGIALGKAFSKALGCLLYTSPSPRDRTRSRMPSSA